MSRNLLLNRTVTSYEWPSIDICGPLDSPDHTWWDDRERDFNRAIKSAQPRPRSRRRKRLGKTFTRRGYAYNQEQQLHLRTTCAPLDLLDTPPEAACALLYGVEQTRSLRGCHRRELPTRELVTILSYPLHTVAVVRVRPYRLNTAWLRGTGKRTKASPYERMDVGWLLWCLAQAYKHIYEHADDYGVWGHALGDLCFAHLMIDGHDVDLGVDS